MCVEHFIDNFQVKSVFRTLSYLIIICKSIYFYFILYFRWCGPCKALEPRLENIVAKRKGNITLAKVDIDSLGEVAAKYEVGTIPALVVFKNGKVQERLIGLQDEDKLSMWVDKVLDSK